MEKLNFKSISLFGAYIPWLMLYVGANILGGIWMLNTGYLIGDVEGEKVYNDSILIVVVLFVSISYIFIMISLFNFLKRIKIPRITFFKRSIDINYKLGFVILCLQIGFFAYNAIAGVNIAGSLSNSTSSIVGFFWIFVPIDLLFLIYYGTYHGSPLVRTNLIVYIFSNLIRGWSGIFLYVLFFEWCNAFRKGSIKWRIVLLVLISAVVLYPFLLSLKWIMRSAAIETISFTLMVETFISNFSSISYIELLTQSIEQLLGRFQHSSIVVEIIHYKDVIQSAFNNGYILPFWSDGLPQLTFRELFGLSSPPSAGVALTTIFFPNDMLEVGSWNTHVGFVGWFFIAPYYSLIYLIYMVLLCFISIVLVKQIANDSKVYDVLWLSWLVFLMPSWIMAFVGFIYSLILFILLQIIIQFISKIKFNYDKV